MKLCRKLNIEEIYKENGITAENGWLDNYNWRGLKRKSNILLLFIIIFMIIIFNIIEHRYVEFDKIEFRIILLISALFFIFILTPIHELIHVLCYSSNIFDKKSFIIIEKFSIGAFYAGIVSRKRLCITLIIPFIVFSIIQITLILITSELIRLFFIYELILHVAGCYTDIMMFCYYIIGKRFSKETIYLGGKYLYKDNKVL
jgi:hypothetical protein